MNTKLVTTIKTTTELEVETPYTIIVELRELLEREGDGRTFVADITSLAELLREMDDEDAAVCWGDDTRQHLADAIDIAVSTWGQDDTHEVDYIRFTCYPVGIEDEN